MSKNVSALDRLRVSRRRSTQFPIASRGKTHQSQCIEAVARRNIEESLSAQLKVKVKVKVKVNDRSASTTLHEWVRAIDHPHPSRSPHVWVDAHV